MKSLQKHTRKSKITLPRYKKEILENSKNSSSEEIIEVGEEKNLYCIDLRNNIFQKTKAPIINENTPYYSNISKLKTKAQTKNKNNSKNKRYRNSTKKIKLKRKLFLNDNISDSEEENEEKEEEEVNEEEDEEEEKNFKKIIKKEKSKIKKKQKSKFKKLTKKDLNLSISSSSSSKNKSNTNKANSNKITSNNSSDSEKKINTEIKNSKVNNKKKIEKIQFLPCRENEQNQIYNYIKSGLNTKGAYSSLYIAGFPGTGKTVSVQTVIKVLFNESLNKKVPNFRELYINGMKFTNPSNVFKVIYNFIFDDKNNKLIKTYIQLLDAFFINRDNFDSKPELNDPSNSHIILIIDEVDCLINQKQTLLYNIFNWTTYSKSKLIVISISNTLDLPQRLIPKVQSRIGTNKIMFKAYLKEDLYKIISTKIEDIKLFSEDALKISSMKVAAVNGDLRRLLQICKKAKEIFYLEKKTNSKINKITKGHIIKACNELFDSKLVKVISSLKNSEKIILMTILAKTNEGNIKISDIYDKKDIFIQKFNEKNNTLKDYIEMNWDDFQMIIFNLVKLKIINFEGNFNHNFIENSISIRFYVDEFNMAIDNEPIFNEVSALLRTIVENKKDN